MIISSLKERYDHTLSSASDLMEEREQILRQLMKSQLEAKSDSSSVPYQHQFMVMCSNLSGIRSKLSNIETRLSVILQQARSETHSFAFDIADKLNSSLRILFRNESSKCSFLLIIEILLLLHLYQTKSILIWIHCCPLLLRQTSRMTRHQMIIYLVRHVWTPQSIDHPSK